MRAASHTPSLSPALLGCVCAVRCTRRTQVSTLDFPHPYEARSFGCSSLSNPAFVYPSSCHPWTRGLLPGFPQCSVAWFEYSYADFLTYLGVWGCSGMERCCPGCRVSCQCRFLLFNLLARRRPLTLLETLLPSLLEASLTGLFLCASRILSEGECSLMFTNCLCTVTCVLLPLLIFLCWFLYSSTVLSASRNSAVSVCHCL